MSIEDTMKDMAESQRELAAAMREYASVIAQYSKSIVSAATGAADEAPAELKSEPKAKPGRPAGSTNKKKEEPAPPAEEPEDDDNGDDGFGEEDENTSAVSFDDVKEALKGVAKKHSKDKALEILGKFGYKGIPEIKEADYAKVHAAATKLL